MWVDGVCGCVDVGMNSYLCVWVCQCVDVWVGGYLCVWGGGGGKGLTFEIEVLASLDLGLRLDTLFIACVW